MSLPVETDFALIKIGDGGGTEVFTIACGIQDITVNETVNTSDRFVRDCAKPGEIPYRQVKATSKQIDVSASGLLDKAHVAIYRTAAGKVKNYKIEYYADDGTDAGVLIGTWAGAFMLTSINEGIPREGTTSVELNLASDGAATWTAAT
jgi:hypothetical protein